MKTYIYSFDGTWPVGAFMLVRAKNRTDADELFKCNLPKGTFRKNIKNGKIDEDSVTVDEIKRGTKTRSDC